MPRNHVKSEIQRKQLLAERDHYNDFGRAKIIAELITNFHIAVSNLQSCAYVHVVNSYGIVCSADRVCMNAKSKHS